MKKALVSIAGYGLLGTALLASISFVAARRGNAQVPPSLPPEPTTITATATAEPQRQTWVGPATAAVDPASDLPPMQPGLVFTENMKDLDYSIEGRTLHLSMLAAFLNARPDMRYVCWIRVTPVGQRETTLFRHVFEGTIIQADGHTARGKLDDSVEIPLEAGNYDLLIHWNGLPPGEGLEVIEDPRRQALEEHLIVATPIEIL